MINTVISYCTNDHKFLEPCVASALQFSDTVVVVYGESFYDGTPENQKQLEEDMLRCPDATFVANPYKETMHPRWHHNSAREVAVKHLATHNQSSEFTFFLDVDEVVEADKFLAWWGAQDPKEDVYEMACFWYFRDPSFQATKTERAGLLIRTSLLPHANMFGPHERWSIPTGLTARARGNVLGLDNEPMVHHYSWVRSKEEMIKKVQSWGHNKDRDWEKLIEESFENPFSVKDRDFVHNYHYRLTIPYIEWEGVNTL